jgi:hypothetical protein
MSHARVWGEGGWGSFSVREKYFDRFQGRPAGNAAGVSVESRAESGKRAMGLMGPVGQMKEGGSGLTGLGRGGRMRALHSQAMKVIEDKVTVYPPHAICRADVRTILSSVPDAWVENIETVRLSAAQKFMHVAIYNEFDNTLTIASRGLAKEQALERILIELAANGLGMEFVWGHRVQGRDASRLRRIVAPLVEEILPQLSKKKVWLDKRPNA